MKDLNLLIYAIIVLFCMVTLNYGFVWAAYIYIAILGYSSFNTIIASAGVLNGIVDAQENIRELKENGWIRPSTMTMFLLQIIHVVMLYKMFIVGFVFTTGFFAAVLAIQIIGNIFVAIKGED